MSKRSDMDPVQFLRIRIRPGQKVPDLSGPGRGPTNTGIGLSVILTQFSFKPQFRIWKHGRYLMQIRNRFLPNFMWTDTNTVLSLKFLKWCNICICMCTVYFVFPLENKLKWRKKTVIRYENHNFYGTNWCLVPLTSASYITCCAYFFTPFLAKKKYRIDLIFYSLFYVLHLCTYLSV